MKKMAHRFVVMLSGLVMALGLSAVAATPAQAAMSDCAQNRICFWTSTSYTGSRMQVQLPPVGQCINVNSPYDNNIDSAWNRTFSSIEVYTSYNCVDLVHAYMFDPNEFTSNINNASNGAVPNNTISSYIRW